MAKKNKRQSRKVSVSTPAVAGTYPSTTTNETFTRSTYQEFHPDYSYVKKDLKRIAILVGSMFVFLIAMTFILPMLLH